MAIPSELEALFFDPTVLFFVAGAGPRDLRRRRGMAFESDYRAEHQCTNRWAAAKARLGREACENRRFPGLTHTISDLSFPPFLVEAARCGLQAVWGFCLVVLGRYLVTSGSFWGF